MKIKKHKISEFVKAEEIEYQEIYSDFKKKRTIEERKLMEHYDKPLIITHYPKEVMAFYKPRDPKDPKAALCYDIKSTKLSRLHNNANVMAIGSKLIKKNVALKCVNTFLKTDFEAGRHLRRVKKI